MNQSKARSGHTRPVAEAALRAVTAQAHPDVSPPNTWRPYELYDVLTNPKPPCEPAIFERTDGQPIFYPGKDHLLSGEPEAGKSKLSRAVGISEMRRGNGFAYFDFEETAEAFIESCQALGATLNQLVVQTYYVRPEGPIEDWSLAELIEAMKPEPSVVVYDANTELLSLHGLDANSGTDWAKLNASLIRPVGDATKAARIMLDHVTKDRDTRHRYAIGTGHKLATVDVAYTLETIKPFGRESAGSSRLRLVKDRPGHLRQHTDDSGVLGIVNYIPGEDGALRVTVDPPEAGVGGSFRPTHLMERASRHIEANPGDATRVILEAVGGKREWANKALRCLDDEGFVTVDQQGSSRRYTSVKTFRENEDRYPTVSQGGEELDF